MANLVADYSWLFMKGFQDYWKERNDPRPQVHGLMLFTGLPGQGKTISVTHMCHEAKAAYGDGIQVLTNYGWKGEDGEFDGDWQSLLAIARTAKVPTIIALDEIGTLLSARSWADFPPEVLSLVSQRRKLSQGAGVRIIGTVQRLWMTDKYLRELADAIIVCRTVWGRLLTQAWYAPGAFDPASGVIRAGENPFRVRRIRLTAQLWEQYDTFKVIERLAPSQDPESRRSRTGGVSRGTPSDELTLTIPGMAHPIKATGVTRIERDRLRKLGALK